MAIDVHVESAWAEGRAPDEGEFSRWAAAALTGRRDAAEVSVLVVDRDEGAALNLRYRGREGPTNVLSFPADLPPGIELPLIGDLVICGPVVESEAAAQNKTVEAHWAHLTVHGVLHLIGYDHQDDAEAAVMEGLETHILAELGYKDPYTAEHGPE
ncbi:MAG TPA: rRNA maturation RNase YbeY [Gammaproteobacteria bacterium]|nr:rRNA maturation RNase YbeY [Gammaproteobacteria bacterium]